MSSVCETTQTIAKSSLLHTIGQTPLLRLSQMVKPGFTAIFQA